MVDALDDGPWYVALYTVRLGLGELAVLARAWPDWERCFVADGLHVLSKLPKTSQLHRENVLRRPSSHRHYRMQHLPSHRDAKLHKETETRPILPTPRTRREPLLCRSHITLAQLRL